jgi:hypothetical protein
MPTPAPLRTATRAALALACGLIAVLPTSMSVANEPQPPDLTCPPARLPFKDMVVVCVDASADSVSYRLFPEGTRAVKPNRHFLVHVIHPQDRRPSMSLGGTAGSWAMGSRSTFKVSGDISGTGSTGELEEGPAPIIATQRVFAPRMPGAVDLSVSFTDDAGGELGDPLTLEFVVDETYSGAFRVGVAGIFVGGLESTYETVLAPGSNQTEISGGTRNFVDIDLVIGYSPYLDAGGRPANGCDNRPFCFNPYFGVGILGADGGGDLDWLKSVHVGIEWELTDTFAIGLTANLRRVSRLAPGLDVGEPIEGGLPTRAAYIMGLGIVLNVSPEFLKIGAEGARAVLR